MSRPQDIQISPQVFRAVILMAMIVVVGKAIAIGHAPLDRLAVSDNDDIMRFLSVRDWLNGQSWFDMTQYRMLPPEGVDLHWSRYVDLGIALIIWPLAQILPQHVAEGVAIVAWPTILLLLLVLATALAGRRLFGPFAAIVAVMSVVLWPPTGLTYFAPARIDHHNVQILLTTIVILTLVLPGRPGRMGLWGGLAGALSLAVGLEAMPAVAAAGLILAGRTALLWPGAGRQLTLFSLSLAAAATLFFAGQNAPEAWLVHRCDELSPPFLALAVMGALICTFFAAVASRLPGPGTRIAVLLFCAVAGLVALRPLIEPCLSGPYGALPPEIQTIISERIIEARPVLSAPFAAEGLGFRFVFPAAAAVVTATLIWCIRRISRRGSAGADRAAATLLIFGWLGILASLFQIRLVLMGAGAIPLLTGYAVSGLMPARDTGRISPVLVAGMLLCIAATLLSPALYNLSRPSAESSGTRSAASVDADSCREPELLETLAGVEPPGLVLSSGNFGPPLLLTTPHDVVVGPYHRSAEAIANGVLPFDGAEETLRAALARTGANYLLLCRDAIYGDGSSYATRLATGQEADGLVPVEVGPDPALVLLRVADP